MFKRFLIPIDGSVRSEMAIDEGVKLAQKAGAEVTLYHVVPDYNVFVHYDRTGDAYRAFISELEKQGEEILHKTREAYAGYGVIKETKISKGNPVQKICTEAKQGRYDLIVMGSRGLGDVMGFLLGSVSSKVVKHADCSVLIVK